MQVATPPADPKAMLFRAVGRLLYSRTMRRCNAHR